VQRFSGIRTLRRPIFRQYFFFDFPGVPAAIFPAMNEEVHILPAELIDFGAGQSALSFDEGQHLADCRVCQNDVAACVLWCSLSGEAA
jgi:hypothetical protein